MFSQFVRVRCSSGGVRGVSLDGGLLPIGLDRASPTALHMDFSCRNGITAAQNLNTFERDAGKPHVGCSFRLHVTRPEEFERLESSCFAGAVDLHDVTMEHRFQAGVRAGFGIARSNPVSSRPRRRSGPFRIGENYVDLGGAAMSTTVPVLPGSSRITRRTDPSDSSLWTMFDGPNG